MNLFGVKSLESLQSEANKGGLVRALGAKDLLFLGIGAVIGAGIFSTLGTAAVGEPGVRAAPVPPWCSPSRCSARSAPWPGCATPS